MRGRSHRYQTKSFRPTRRQALPGSSTATNWGSDLKGIGRKSVFTKPMLAASGAASLLLCSLGSPALSQTPPAGNGVTALPEINVIAPKQVAGKPKQRAKPRLIARRAGSPRTASSQPTASPAPAPVSPAEQLAAKGNSFDQARSNIFTTIGTTSNTISHNTIEDLPQGPNATVEQVLLQAPGVSQDSAASGSLHIRNDH